MLSTHTTHRLRALVLVVALAALLAPAARAQHEPAGKYGALDPWAYNLVHRSSASVPLVTEHSAGQNGTGQATAAGKYGELDPWAHNVIDRSAPSVSLITDHSAAAASAWRGSPLARPERRNGQNGTGQAIAAASAPIFEPRGFAWGDAGIGAAAALAAMLLAIAVAGLVVRRGRIRPAGF